MEDVFDKSARWFVADAMSVAILPIVLDVLVIFYHLQHGRRQNGTPGSVSVQSMFQTTVLEDQVDVSYTSGNIIITLVVKAFTPNLQYL